MLETNLTYTLGQKNVSTGRKITLASGMKGWVNLVTPKEGVVLLGRVTLTKSNAIEVEYILMDTTQENIVTASPAIKTRLGEKAEITFGLNKSSESLASISLMARKAP